MSVEKIDDLIRRGEKMLATQLQEVEAHQKQKQVEADDHRYETNAWLDRAGWAKHLTPYAESELPKLIATPQREGSDAAAHEEEAEDAPSEAELWRACQATMRMLRKAQKACHPEAAGYHALEYVNRRETGQKNNEKPFYGRQMSKTMKKYGVHFTPMLSYIWRRYDSVEPQPPYRLTSRQRDRWESLRDAVPDFEAHRRPEKYRCLEAACLEFWISLADHQLKDHEDESALVSGAALLGWDAIRGRWKIANDYTPPLSGIITLFRMLVVYRAYQQREAEVQQQRDCAYDEETAPQRAPSHFSLVPKMVHRFMTLTELGGQPSPMNFLLRLRPYGRTIRMNSSEDGVIRWHRDEVQCGSVRFTMSALRSMVHGLVDSTWTELRRNLLLLDVNDRGEIVPGSTPIPPLDLDQLYDHPSELEKDGSLLKDPRNTFAVDGPTWLYRRIFREPAFRQRFIDAEASDELEDAMVAWRGPEIERYSQVVTNVQINLLVLMELSGGGPWRGSCCAQIVTDGNAW